MHSVPAPFDAVAADYDADFTNRRLGRWLRQIVWRRLEEVFRPGERVLELGCGTGADAVRLAQRDVHVLATDASAAMLQVARSKAAAAGVESRLAFARLDLAAPDRIEHQVIEHEQHDRGIGQSATLSGPFTAGEPFDGAYSNFGALNCVADRRAVATVLARVVRRGGYVVLVLMSPVCPWEMLWHLLHGEVRRAARRLRAGHPAHVGHGRYVRVWYPSPRRLETEFAPAFRLVGLEGLSALLPPTDLSHLVERWPRPFEALMPLEERLRRKLPWTWLNDHYLATFQHT